MDYCISTSSLESSLQIVNNKLLGYALSLEKEEDFYIDIHLIERIINSNDSLSQYIVASHKFCPKIILCQFIFSENEFIKEMVMGRLQSIDIEYIYVGKIRNNSNSHKYSY